MFALSILRNCDISSDKLYFLIYKKYFDFGTLKYINLDNNQLGDLGGAYLLFLISKFSNKIDYLNISNNKLGKQSYELIIDILEKNNVKIIGLSIGGNKLGDKSFSAITEAISKNIYLQKLFVHNNELGKISSSILGTVLITIFLSLFLFFGIGLSSNNLDFNNPRNLMILLILIIALALLFLNKKLSPIFLIAMGALVLAVNIGIISPLKINLTLLVFSIFFGLSSHIIMDSFTPAGVKAFSPFNDRGYHKKFGISLFLIVVLMFILLFPNKLLFYLGLFSNFN